MQDKIKNIILTCLLWLFLIGFCLINTFTSDQEISLSERRLLQEFPTFNTATILNGSFMKNFETYSIDQFYLRDRFRQIKALNEFNLFMKKDNNDLFISDKHIFKILYPLNEKHVKAGTDKISYIKEKYLTKHKNIYYSIIPDKNYFLPDEGYLKIDYQKMLNLIQKALSDITYIDLFDTLTLDNYYRTDLHFRQESLMPVIEKLSKSMNLKVINDYKEKSLGDFPGTYYSQLSMNFKVDELIYLTNDTTNQATTFNYEKNLNSTVYDLSKINAVDLYEVFLSGTVAILDINNPLATSDRELIIFRDSFASTIVPLILHNYQKITLIDLRYIHSDYLVEYIEFKNQDILFLYSVNIFNNGALLK